MDQPASGLPDDSVLAAVCAAFGLDPAQARLVQHSVNALYRFPRASVMVRLSRGSATHLVRIAGELADRGVPVIRLAPGVPQPAEAGGWSATAWQLLPPPPPGRHPAADLAAPLTALHAARLNTPLPAWDLAGDIRAFLDRHAAGPDDWCRVHLGLSRADLFTRLHDRCAELAHDLARVTWARPPATVHGDAHTGNLLRTPAGEPVLCDLDAVSWGPPEADLTPAAHAVTRFARDPGDYARFAERYGFDVLTWPDWPILRRLRDLQLAVYLLPRPPADSRELAHRLHTVLADNESARWHRFRQFA